MRVDTYIRAWIKQDPNLIVTVFTETATYHERALDEPIRDHAGIREYWRTKVQESQRNITCELLKPLPGGEYGHRGVASGV
ncbi:nuclear transport factor 2 family protein [Jidongwangia harbinensis]|uniref:nuclear transport factor 2 family protein n=1 Tax=Jidongwangia harbinensis TaxID=2878561 RepID=UPI001CD98F68|nr:nuclear transport factor 2 family protein [Jidongwangia harbinensis]MCA2217664.1 nuclear transport factor 2 family protein [Jidongwangia harbinensis]